MHALVQPASTVGARERYHPLLDGLQPLLGEPGLRKGVPYAVQGSTSLALAMIAGASAAGSWAAAVGIPALGTRAAENLGVDLDLLAVVDDPGAQWLDVLATLCDALDLIVVRPTGRVSDPQVRRITARMRARGCTVIVLGDARWPGAFARLSVGPSTWLGLEECGHLTARHAPVTVTGKGAPTVVPMWLPDTDGKVRPYIDIAPRLRAVP